jgi:hypothetical protein
VQTSGLIAIRARIGHDHRLSPALAALAGQVLVNRELLLR